MNISMATLQERKEWWWCVQFIHTHKSLFNVIKVQGKCSLPSGVHDQTVGDDGEYV